MKTSFFSRLFAVPDFSLGRSGSLFGGLDNRGLPHRSRKSVSSMTIQEMSDEVDTEQDHLPDGVDWNLPSSLSPEELAEFLSIRREALDGSPSGVVDYAPGALSPLYADDESALFPSGDED